MWPTCSCFDLSHHTLLYINFNIFSAHLIGQYCLPTTFYYSDNWVIHYKHDTNYNACGGNIIHLSLLYINKKDGVSYALKTYVFLKPSILHKTLASFNPKVLPQIVPQSPSCFTSTRPLPMNVPLTNLTSVTSTNITYLYNTSYSQ